MVKLGRRVSQLILLLLASCAVEVPNPSTTTNTVEENKSASTISPDPLIVTTAQGTLKGSWADRSRGIRRYAGIPFAAPPIGVNRWQLPKPPLSWNKIRNAEQFGPACYQDFTENEFVWRRGSFTRSEDCLYLNLWVPTNAIAKKHPVMVWLHGGSHTGGYGHSKIFDGTALASRDVIVVTINYRLGVFGFLAHPALAEETTESVSGVGNYGLWDTIAALRWVQDKHRQLWR